MKELRKSVPTLLVLLSLGVAGIIAVAGVFVYYPMQVNVSLVSPPVVFAYGSNANQPDMGSGNTIIVSIGANSTSLALTIHPTYQTTYYENITLIKNQDATSAYNMSLIVYKPLTGLPQYSKVYLIVYSSGATRSLTGWPPYMVTNSTTPMYLNVTSGSYRAILDLTSTGSATFKLNAGETVEIDLIVYIPEGTYTSGLTTASVYLVYSPEDVANAPLPTPPG